MLFQLVLNREKADEVTQDVFVNVLRGLHRFREEAEFTTWLHRIALNAAKEAARHESFRRRQDVHDVPVGDSQLPAPESLLMQQEQRETIHRALSRLSLALRTAVVLTVMQGHSAIAAAELEGCPLGTMYWRIHEARRLLRDELRGLIE